MVKAIGEYQAIKILILFILSLSLLVFSCNEQKRESKNDQAAIELLDYFGTPVRIEREFYEDGSIKVEGTFSLKPYAQEHHGYEYWYYPDGRYQYRLHYDNNVKIGPAYEYLPSGQLNKYRFYNPFGELVYFIEYNDSKEIVKEDGKRTPFAIYDYEKDKVSIYSPDIQGFMKNLFLYKDEERIAKIANSTNLFDQFELKLPNDSEFDLVVEYVYGDSILKDSLKLVTKHQ